MALAAEYDEMLDSCNQKIELANQDLRARGLELERLSEQVEALTRERHELQLTITQQQQQQQPEEVDVGDKELTELKAQLVALQASSSSTIADLQSQLKQSHDESASLSVSSALSKSTADKKDNNEDLARQIVDLTKTNEQLQSHLVNLAKEFQTYKETSMASMAGSEEKAAQHIAQLQKERDTLAIKLELANKDANAPPLPPMSVASSSSSTSSTDKPLDSDQTRALASLTDEYHVYKYTAENELAVANDTTHALRRANQLLQNEIDQLTEDFGAYKTMTEATIADIETLHAARYRNTHS